MELYRSVCGGPRKTASNQSNQQRIVATIPRSSHAIPPDQYPGSPDRQDVRLFRYFLQRAFTPGKWLRRG